MRPVVLFGGFTFSRPSHITVARKALFEAGNGRRYMRMSVALGGVGHPIGSVYAARVKSAFVGIGMSMRTFAFDNICVELAARFGLETPGGRQSDPSNTNSGSLAGRFCAKAGVIVHPA